MSTHLAMPAAERLILLPEDFAPGPREPSQYALTKAGVLLPRELVEELTLKARRPTCVALFAGAGGFSLGAIQSGYQILVAAEHDCAAAVNYIVNLGAYPMRVHYVTPEDEKALNIYLASHGHTSQRTAGGIEKFDGAGSGWIAQHPGTPGVPHFILGDLRQITGQQILQIIGLKRGELDCVIGGPPCQGYSHGGKRDVMDPRNSLIFEFARLVCELGTKSMVMENVSGIITMTTPAGVPVLDAMARIFEDGGFIGYEAFVRSLKAQQPHAFGLLREHPPGSSKEERTEQPDLFAMGDLFASSEASSEKSKR